MSSVFIRGQPKVPSSFEPNAFKSNRHTVEPESVVQPVEEGEGMPGWAIGLIVLGCIVAAMLIAIFVLVLVRKGPTGTGSNGIKGPVNEVPTDAKDSAEASASNGKESVGTSSSSSDDSIQN